MTKALQELAAMIELKQADAVNSTAISHGELTVNVAPAHIIPLLRFLRDDPSCAFSTLIDITAVDYPSRPQRFDVVWHLLSMYQNHRVRVKIAIRDGEVVPSSTPVFSAANWYEREIFDLFGIVFSGHPDLRRIVTDYGFHGYPLRKDFPTSGYVELRYDEDRKRVVYEPIEMVQEYRSFDFMSPWEGAKYILPGDDKAEAK